ncbi:MAG: protein-L-isoaspartate(D-aspartate) O-methyltransferase [candidate division Zixibacteria bacterium]|nr:protein-L-isoaspartate(D-aspartate) O-methyltransferase [candidate division Zixibacteria bacterium]
MTEHNLTLSESEYFARRMKMIENQIISRGVQDPDVLAAMRTVPRHLFVPNDNRGEAYADYPVAIGHAQTISQPFIVASMTEHLKLTHRSRVLEIGTGCGYQTAVLAEIAREVYTVEIIPELFSDASRLLRQLGYTNVFTQLRDGNEGWPDKAPFDAITVAAASKTVPSALTNQLGSNGRMLIPLVSDEDGKQELILLEKGESGISTRVLYDVRFVPLRSKSAE